MKYLKVQYSVSLDGIGYQEISDDGSQVVRHTDLDGNTVVLNADYRVEVVIIDKNPMPPDWAK